MTKPLFVEPRGLGQHEPFVLRSRRVVLPEGERPAALRIEGGRIRAISAWEDAPAGLPLHDAGEDALLPGLVDIHVHLNEPGPESHFEGFRAGGQAALRGGITTILDMPLNSIPVTTTPEALEVKRAAAEAANCPVRVGFIGGLVPDNAHRMEELIDAGVVAVKAFLCDSGLPEFPAAREEDLRIAMLVLARRGVPLLAHAELVDDEAPAMANPYSLRSWEESRPQRFEMKAIALLANLASESGCPVHIVHLASGRMAVSLKGLLELFPVTVETCPHYLVFSDQTIPDNDPRLKCAPPIRNQGNREALWSALGNGTIQAIASDHSPCHLSLKHTATGNIAASWGGISSLGLALPLMLREGKLRGFKLAEIVPWLSSGPARCARLPEGIGQLIEGGPADIVQLVERVKWTVCEEHFPVTHPQNCPYLGQKVEGWISHVWAGGSQTQFPNPGATP